MRLVRRASTIGCASRERRPAYSRCRTRELRIHGQDMSLDAQQPALRRAVPVLLVGDIESTMRWYAEKLEFQGRAVPLSPPHTFGIMTRDRVTIFLQQLDGYEPADLYDDREGGVWHVYMETDDVHALFDGLSSDPSGCIIEPLAHQDYGQTEFVIRDVNGYSLVLAQPD